jgi:hypothetical protein
LGYLAGDDQSKKRSEAFFRDVSRQPMHEELAGQPYSPLITLMTADYILTIRDLPGWPGSFPPINYRDLLLKSMDELAHGLYAKDRLTRELAILHAIAEKHGLGEFFRKRIDRMRRYESKTPFEGNGISPSMIFLDADHYGIHNIFDAAYVAHYMHQIAPKLSVSSVWHMVANSLAYRMRSLRKGDRFPLESEWLNPNVMDPKG